MTQATTPTQPPQVFLVGCRSGDNAGASPDAMGFKAYNLWRMHGVGLKVPQAFVLGTRYCRDYLEHGRTPPADLRETLARYIREVERASGLGFGSSRKPLLVSVRSGAPVSMPGMLDTVLNIGLCDSTVPGLVRLTGHPRLVWDNYRRLVQSFAETVHGSSPEPFEAALGRHLASASAASVDELDFQDLRALTREHLDLFEKHARRAFPQQPIEQLEAAVAAVFEFCSG